jgi:hypothetical protein
MSSYAALHCTNEDINIAAFRQLVNSITEYEDFGEHVNNNWKTYRFSHDGEYDWMAAGRDVIEFIYGYVDHDVHRYSEALSALGVVLAAVMYYCYADEHGFLSRRLIEETLDWIERVVHENLVKAYRRYKEHTVQ